MSMSYDLSDGLTALRRWLADYEGTGVTLSGEDVRELRRQLSPLTTMARKMEHEVSRHRWNELAKADLRKLAEQEEVVVAEAARPGTNLRLLSRTGVPFTDGNRPEGRP